MSPSHPHTAQSPKTLEPRNHHRSNSIRSPVIEPSHPSPQSLTAPTPGTLGRSIFKTSEVSLQLEEPEVKSPKKSQIAVHWILWHLDDDSFPLLMDLSRRKRDITNVLTSTPWWDVDVLSRPATRPAVLRLRLISPKALTIDIENDQGVTVYDVICHLFETFKRPISSNDLEIFPPGMLRHVRFTFQENGRHWTGNPAKKPKEVRWVDTLFDEPLFVGLSAEHELLSKYGENERDTATFVMNFKPRSVLQ